MKLQAKFTIAFIVLVLVTIGISFFMINWSFEVQFDRFIKEKNQQWQQLQKGGSTAESGGVGSQQVSASNQGLGVVVDVDKSVVGGKNDAPTERVESVLSNQNISGDKIASSALSTDSVGSSPLAQSVVNSSSVVMDQGGGVSSQNGVTNKASVVNKNNAPGVFKSIPTGSLVVIGDDGLVVLPMPMENPFDNNNKNHGKNGNSPEQRYLNTVTGSLIWAGLIDILFAIVLAYMLSRIMLKRILGLKDAMKQYMRDRSAKPVVHNSSDEVDDLAKIYNSMIEKVEREERVRKDFFVDMSHELRTPLTSIKGYLEGLVDNVFDDDKQKEVQEKTLKETDRMIHLVKEMTALANLETENVPLNKEKCELRTMTDEVCEMVDGHLADGGVSVVVKGEVNANVDPYKMKQVLINLLDNAAQYALNGSVIKVEMGCVGEVRAEEKGGVEKLGGNIRNGACVGGSVFWKISNEVKPNSVKDIDHLFERFYRGDKSRNYDAKKPHLGIGLNIVKRIVELHGGLISARLDDEKTVTFEICLPE